MSPLNIAWSMAAGACAIIGLTHFFLWVREPAHKAYLLSATMSAAAAASALLELALLKGRDVDHYGRLLQWENTTIFVLLVTLVWYVDLRLGSRRRWLAYLITLLWIATLVVNFQFPHSVVFSEIQSLNEHVMPWGETYVHATGQLNPWLPLPNIAVLLIIAYVADAGLQCWRRGERSRAVLIGGSVVLFMLIGGIHAPLVDAGLLRTPYMISFAYMAIVFALAYELADSTRQASVLAHERAEAVSEAREAREDLERFARASLLGELVTSIAHELNQPLAAILANVQAGRRLLSAGDPDLEELRAILDDVVRDDKRASEVIHRLRALLQKQPGHLEPIQLGMLVRETCGLMHSELQATHIRLTIDAGEPDWTVQADRVAMQQVVLNLLTNAIRALGQVPAAQRLLHISVTREDAGLCLRVADRGPGIPEDSRPLLFEPFYASRNGSLGMGLVLCKRIVEAHGGKIDARNRSGGGAEVRITLPMAVRDA